MKKLKSIISLALTGVLAMSVTGCSDDLKDVNIDPAMLTDPTPQQLFTGLEYSFNPFGYGIWFFNAAPALYTNQMAVPSGSINEDRILAGADRPGFLSLTALKYLHAIENSMANTDGGENYEAIRQAAVTLAIYGGIYDTDMAGDIPYTEAGQAAYGGTLTPKYDTVEDLYNLWITQLDEAVSVLSNPPTPEGGYDTKQDLIYACDWSKWAKFANSLRVKLAVRLVHRDMAKAKQLVATALAAPCGLITETSDDLIFNKASENIKNGSGSSLDAGDVAFGTGNTTIDYNGVKGSKRVVDFMVKNGDPRVRFYLTKNQWNSTVVNFYLQNGHINQIPPVILEKVNYVADGANYKFVSWKGKGEPWVRYVGIPDDYRADLSTDPAMKQYFNYSAGADQGGNSITFEGTTWAYCPYSSYNEYHLQGRRDFRVTYAPGEVNKTTSDVTDRPRHDMYISAAEINFYLAEFALYGGVAGIGSAETYYNKAVRQSVETWDKFARLNQIPYYNKTYNYDPNEGDIALQDGEIDALLQQPDYAFTGDKNTKLEKIALNLMFHLTFSPVDQFVTGRRTGCPKIGSTLYPRVVYAEIPVTKIPRRSLLSAISPNDLMGPNVKEAYTRQGLSTAEGDNDNYITGYLNSERLWQDVGAPQWGAGPNL